jgi:GT2 family glycosyltransferase
MLAVAGSCDRLLALSETLRQRFIELGTGEEQTVLWELGIDHRPFAGLSREPARHLRLGFFGSLMVSKAPHLLLEAFAGLPPGSATLRLYGEHAAYHSDDSYRRRLEPLLATEGVRHEGAIPHADVPRALAEIDVVVMPSIWLENSPLVIREAFLAGAPVVAAGHGGMAEMVEHERNGLLFAPGDAGDLRRSLQRFLDDPGLLPRLRAGIGPVRTIEDDAEQLIVLFRSLIGRPRRPCPRLAAVVLNYQTPQLTRLAVRSLQSSHRRVDDLIVVDNGSGDDSLDFLQKHLADVDLVSTGAKLGFSAGCNTGIKRALDRSAELILLLNGDAMVTAETVGRLEAVLTRDPEAGITGPVALALSDPLAIDSAGIRFSITSGRMHRMGAGDRFDPQSPPAGGRVAAVSGCAMLIRRQVLEQVGLLDEDYFFYFEDLDLCLRAAGAGCTTHLAGDAIVYHQGSASMPADSPDRIYYATRNHLLAASRAAPVSRSWAALRAGLIIGYNLAFALRGSGVARPAAVAAVLRGTADFLRGRLGRSR